MIYIPNQIRVIKSRRIRWVGRRIYIRQKINSYRVLVGRPENVTLKTWALMGY
jgi:hypothetical protein